MIDVIRRPPPDAQPPSSTPRALEHERAFRRWSMPAASEVECDIDPPQSFRVYTPAELRAVPLRSSSRPSELRPPPAAGANTVVTGLLQWLGMGMALGLVLVTATVVYLHLHDDLRGRATGARIMSMVAPARAPEASASPTPAPSATEASAPTDFELPDDAQPAKRPKKKAKLAVRDNPF